MPSFPLFKSQKKQNGRKKTARRRQMDRKTIRRARQRKKKGEFRLYQPSNI